jgi:aminoglycoside 6'-N-acetyltransferase
VSGVLEPALSFRRLARADFPLLQSWLATAHVARWWADDPSLDAIEATYGGNVDGTEPSEVFVVLADGQPVGLAQRYRIASYPDDLAALAALLQIVDGAGSIDYLLGPPDVLGRGWSAPMIRAFVAMVWHDAPAMPELIVPVHAHNRASWRALEQAGFARVASGPLEPDNPTDSRDHFVYRLTRPAPSPLPR